MPGALLGSLGHTVLLSQTWPGPGSVRMMRSWSTLSVSKPVVLLGQLPLWFSSDLNKKKGYTDRVISDFKKKKKMERMRVNLPGIASIQARIGARGRETITSSEKMFT